ncbi:MAG: hypothetical protein IPJ88_04805 [Myxococcales bacterium]|nr:MAG: hypothetical protein IPJ88_04805 [Myxococcales bacterium]
MRLSGTDALVASALWLSWPELGDLIARRPRSFTDGGPGFEELQLQDILALSTVEGDELARINDLTTYRRDELKWFVFLFPRTRPLLNEPFGHQYNQQDGVEPNGTRRLREFGVLSAWLEGSTSPEDVDPEPLNREIEGLL